MKQTIARNLQVGSKFIMPSGIRFAGARVLVTKRRWIQRVAGAEEGFPRVELDFVGLDLNEVRGTVQFFAAAEMEIF